MRIISKRQGILILLLCLLCGPLGEWAPPLASPIEGGNQWKAEYEAGSAPFRAWSGLRITLDEEHLVLTPKRGPAFPIPLAGIRAVSSNLVAKRTASNDQLAVWGGLAYMNPETLILFPFGMVGILATAPIKSHYAYVDIFWNEKSTEQEVLLRLSRKDYSGFMAELGKATGKEWRNLDIEWEKIKQELANNQANRFPLHLDRRARVGTATLKPGDYTAVVLTRGGDRADLYIFPSGGVSIEHLAAVTGVEVAAPVTEASADPVSYKTQNGTTFLAQIHTPAKTLRLP